MDGAELTAARHLPRLALDWVVDRPGDRWRQVDGTMMFADISGFTALSERLATKGRIGGEELVETLSRVFGAMLDTAADRGGQLLKFGGDALLFLFDGPDHAAQAASTAVEMRSTLRRAGETPTSVGRLSLSISTGIHTGRFDLFLVGAHHRELVVLGPGTSAAIGAENTANGGEIVVTPSTADALPAQSVRPRHDGALLLRWRNPHVAATGVREARDSDDAAARVLLPSLLVESFERSRPDPAHRVATISFMKFTGTDAILARDGPDVLADRLHDTISVAQEAFEAEDVALLCVDCDDDGGKIFCSSGVPLTSEDDEGRMLRAAHAIARASPPLPLQIGVNRGHVFVAEIGTPRRAAFSAMGDTTNTAARICGKAEPGTILAHPAVLEHSRTIYDARPAGPFRFKGKAHEQLLYVVGDELDTRRGDADITAPLVGRANELASIRSLLDETLRGRGAAVTVSGAVGVGKSRLIAEALADWPGATISMHAEPYGSANAYRVFRDPIRDLLGIRRGTFAEMATQLRAGIDAIVPHLAPWTALIADVAQVEVDPSDEVLTLAPRFRPDRTADTILEVLDALLTGPTVFRIEDAHWADTSSAHLAGRLADAARTRPWAVLIARRNGDDGGVELAEARSVEIGELAHDELRAVIHGLTEASPLRPLEVDAVVARAGGNPLFAAELVSLVREVGSADAVPDSLQGALAAQVDALDPLGKRVLSYASVLGRSFRREVLTTVVDREGITVDEATIDGLSKFLEPDGPTRWRFKNGLVRDITYEGLGYRLRERLHGEAGRAVEQVSDDPTGDADVLALHFFAAADHPRALRYSELAALRAERSHAHASAIPYLERAVTSSRRLDRGASTRSGELLVRLGTSRDLSGLLGESIEAFGAALREFDDPLQRAEIALMRARVRERAGSYPAALREATMVHRSLAEATEPEAAALRARCAAFRALVRQRQDRPDAARREAEAAAAEAEAVGERTALARALNVLSWARLVGGDDDPLRDGERALTLFGEVGDRAGQANMANNLGVYAYFTNDWDETLRRYAQAEEALRSIGNVTDAALAAANTGEVLVNQGRLDDAEPQLRDAARVLRASGHLLFATFAEMHLGRLLVATGDLDQAEPILRRCLDDSRALGSGMSAFESAIHLATCLVRLGRAREALDVLEESAAQANEDVSMLESALALVESRALHALGQHDESERRLLAGIEAAQARELSFDLAQLLLFADESGVTTSGVGVDDPRREAESILHLLGVTTS